MHMQETCILHRVDRGQCFAMALEPFITARLQNIWIVITNRRSKSIEQSVLLIGRAI